MRVRAVQMQWGVRIPLRDGIRLSATVYLPKNQSKPSPLIVTVTPYTVDIAHDRGIQYAEAGFPFVAVDSRGRGNSEGEFRPFIQEAKDGYDIVEWLARQSYCDGKVAMLGGSYGGYNQWATAKEMPPHLATIVPTAAPYIGLEFPMRNNIFYPYVMQWVGFTSGRASQPKLFYDRSYWSALFLEWHESGRPFRSLDAMCGNPSSVYQEWLSHPEPDEYWDAYNPTADEYARINIPILTITGSYDDDQPGALEHYRNHLRYAPEVTGSRHYLVIGPWDHQGTSVASMEFGGLQFGSASMIDLPELRLAWYAWTMGGGPQPRFLERRVAYYVMGAERWRYSDSLEEITTHHEPYFLDSSGAASDVFASGILSREPGKGAADSYTYNPATAQTSYLDAEARASGSSLVDQSVIHAFRGSVLVYHSEPFDSDVEVSGFFRLEAWISIDCPDTDLYVSVHEIDRDGGSIRLSTDAMRARYREGPRIARLVRTCEPLRYTFERFTFVSRLLKRGHRLRLVIAPMGRLVETTFAEKNYNAGGVVAEESADDARSVTIRLFHDAARPSALYVPRGRPELSAAAGAPFA